LKKEKSGIPKQPNQDLMKVSAKLGEKGGSRHCW
jgi:hypothetical protein